MHSTQWHRTAVIFSRCNGPYVGQLDDCDLLTVTFLLLLPVLNLPLPLELFVYLHLITGILSLCISAHLTVLLLLNPVLNLTFSLLPNHSYASTSDSTSDYWRYINNWLTLTVNWYIGRVEIPSCPLQVLPSASRPVKTQDQSDTSDTNSTHRQSALHHSDIIN